MQSNNEKPEQKDKLQKANAIVKDFIKEEFDPSHWVYIDFVKEDRFISAINEDENIDISKCTSEELADYAIDNISKSAALYSFLGF